jgi:hypothetical protein
VYLLGATFVEGDGLECRQVGAGSVFTARREGGRWAAANPGSLSGVD